MKAIINVNSKNQYSKFNGLTFPVKEINNSFVAIDLNGATTDFTHKEVLIVDFQKEIQNTRNRNDWGYTSALKELEALKSYQKANNIIFETEFEPAQ